MINRLLVVPVLLMLAATAPASARGSHHSSSGGSHSRSSVSRVRTSSPGEHYTRTYVRKSGTVVGGHYDTNPDGHFGNNYSTKGNVNPHTGELGTKVTPPNGEPD